MTRDEIILEQIQETYPEAQMSDINSPYYTEICDNREVWIHAGETYPICLKDIDK